MTEVTARQQGGLSIFEDRTCFQTLSAAAVIPACLQQCDLCSVALIMSFTVKLL